MFYGNASQTLARFAQRHPAAAVRLCCAACGGGHDVAVAQVLWFLKAFALGDETSLIADAARLGLNPCVRCGATVWEAWPSPAPPPPPGA